MLFTSRDTYPPLIPWQFGSVLFYSLLFYQTSWVYTGLRERNRGNSSILDNQPIPLFGEWLADVDYQLRPSSYVVARNAQDEIAVVSTPLGYFLPGGGQLPNEPPARAAVREAIEECGLHVDLDNMIGVADQLLFAASEATYYRKRSTFFAGRLFRQQGFGEADHKLIWMTLDEALEKLSHKSHAWAVQCAQTHGR